MPKTYVGENPITLFSPGIKQKNRTDKKGIASRKTSHNKIEFIEFEVVSRLQGIGKQKLKKRFFFPANFERRVSMILNRVK